MSNRFWGIAAGLLSVFFSSTYSIFSKYLLQRTIPETLLLIAQFFSVMTILIFFGLLPEIKDILQLKKRMLCILIVVALFSGVLAPLLYMKGLSETLAINAIVTSRLSALFVGIISFVRLKEKCSWQRILGTFLMFCGIFYITSKGFAQGFSVDRGVFLVAMAALCSALGTVLYKRYLFEIKPEIVILIRNGLAMIVFIALVPVLMNISHDVSIGFQGETWIYFIGLALIAIVTAQYLKYEALDHAPASLIAAIGLVTPLSGMILASVFLHETLYGYHAIGTVLLLIGLGVNLIKNISYLPGDSFKELLFFKRNR